jgi:hypothetical protein
MFYLYKYRSIKTKLLYVILVIFLFANCFLNFQMSLTNFEIATDAIPTISEGKEILANKVTEEYLKRIVLIIPLFVIINFGFYFDNNIIQKILASGIQRKQIFFFLLKYCFVNLSFFVCVYLFIGFLLSYMEYRQLLPFGLIIIGICYVLISALFYTFLSCLLLLFFYNRLKAIGFFFIYLFCDVLYSGLVVSKLKMTDKQIFPIGLVRSISIDNDGGYKPFFSLGIWQSTLLICYFTITIFLIYRLVVKKSFPQI